MVEEQDVETTFSPTNSSKDHLNAEQLPQNNFWTLADTGNPEREPILFERRGVITDLIALSPFDSPFSPLGHLHLLPSPSLLY